MTTTYDLVKDFYTDPNYTVEFFGDEDFPRMRQTEKSTTLTQSFLSTDGEHHQTKRGVLMRHLTVKRVNALRPRTQEFVNQCLDDFEARGNPSDITSTIGKVLPMHVLCSILGMPTITDPVFIDACSAIVDSRVTSMEEVYEAYSKITPVFVELYERKKREPGEDLMSAMIQDTAEGKWTEDELRGMGMTLLTAAHDATGVMLNSCIEWLSYDVATFERLKREPEALPRAFEEMLRLLTVGISFPRARMAKEDAILGNTTIKRGESVGGSLLAANTDPAAFPNPLTFDMDRVDPARHVTFGLGPHACPGAQLARMEITLALQEIVKRYSRFENVLPSEGWRERALCKGSAEVVVEWGRS
ncbi:cytochrome P450 [Herbiconiux ginsengi]|nr:cytochrome P450 [Herbiconiux ginsengi]